VTRDRGAPAGQERESRLTATWVAGGFGLLGAVLGSLITLLVSRQNPNRANALLVRDEFRTAVEYASAVITFQKTEMDRWYGTHDKDPGFATAGDSFEIKNAYSTSTRSLAVGILLWCCSS
jgi:hypothetical protein